MKATAHLLRERLARGRPLTLANVADGAEGLVRRRSRARDRRARAARRRSACWSSAATARAWRSFRAHSDSLRRTSSVLEFPAWDCQPYDRVSPHAGDRGAAHDALSRLSRRQGPRAALGLAHHGQRRAPARAAAARSWPTQALSAAPGNMLAMDDIDALARAQRLHPRLDGARAGRLRGARRHRRPVPAGHGPSRCGSISSATRWKSIRSFDPETQRTTDQLARARSRAGDRGAAHDRHDQAIPHRLCRGVRRGQPRRSALRSGQRGPPPSPAWSTGCRCSTNKLDTLFDYLADAPVVLEPLADEAAHERFDADRRLLRGAQAGARRQQRRRALQAAAAGPALSHRSRMARAARRGRAGAAVAVRRRRSTPDVIDVGARQGHNFAAERARAGRQCVRRRDARTSQALQAAGKRVVIALWSDGSRERMAHVLADHGLANLTTVAIWPRGAGAAEARDRARGARPRERLRDRRRRRHRRAGHSRRPPGAPAPAAQAPDNFIAEATQPRRRRSRRPCRSRHRPLRRPARRSRRRARRTIASSCTMPAATSCSCRSRTSNFCRATARTRQRRRARPARRRRLADAQGAHEEPHPRDGGRADQDRRRARNCARRRRSPSPPGLYDEFCARFPYEETEDQQAPSTPCIDDLAHGPADGPARLRRCRLRQDRGGAARGLRDRDDRQAGRGRGADDAAGAPALSRPSPSASAACRVKVAQASRLVSAAELAKTQEGLADGTVDIVIGTHALLGKTDQVQAISAWSSSTRSSISASRTRSG